MRIPRFPKRVWLAFAVILVAYGCGYIYARYTHTLIHRVTYDHGSLFHSIAPGEVSAFTWGRFYVGSSYVAFTPLRWAEAFLWHFIARDYDYYRDHYANAA
jgi:hypothetical protein